MNVKSLFSFACFVLAAAGSTVFAQDALRVGVFDAQRISEETAEGRRIQDRLSAFRDEKQKEIVAREREIASLQDQMTTQALSLSAERRSALEKDIQRKILDLNQARETARTELQLEVADAQQRFEEKLLANVEALGRDEGFNLILERTLVAFSSPALDVTTLLIDRFDRQTGAAPEGEDGSDGE